MPKLSGSRKESKNRTPSFRRFLRQMNLIDKDDEEETTDDYEIGQVPNMETVF